MNDEKTNQNQYQHPTSIRSPSSSRCHRCFAGLGSAPAARHTAQSLPSADNGILPGVLQSALQGLQNLRFEAQYTDLCGDPAVGGTGRPSPAPPPYG